MIGFCQGLEEQTTEQKKQAPSPWTDLWMRNPLLTCSLGADLSWTHLEENQIQLLLSHPES